MRFPYGWYGWVETHRPVPENPAPDTIFPDSELSFVGSEKESTYLGLKHSPDKIRLSELPAKYFLVLLIDKNSLASEQAFNVLDQARKELECCTPDTLYLAVGTGMHKRDVKRFQKEIAVELPLLSDPLETTAAVGKLELPTVFMVRKTDKGLLTMFACSEFSAGPSALAKRVNDALSGFPGRKCVRHK